MSDRIDPAALDRLLGAIGGDPVDLDELIDDFLTTSPDHVDAMRVASAHADRDTVRIHAHTLKANGREFGATALASLCQEFEHECRGESVIDFDDRIDRIETELVAVRHELAGLEGGHD